jgi:hypothetical protein
MLTDESDLNFVRHATAELVLSFTDPKDHNMHAAFNGLIKAIEADRSRITRLEAEIEALRSQTGLGQSDLSTGGSSTKK